MADTLLRGVLADSTVKFMAISGKTMIETARQTHNLSRVCTAALGRTLLMGAMLGAELKSADEKVTAILKGGGMAGNVVVTANEQAIVKGYIENPQLELPPAPNGKLDVALAVGWFGDLTVIKDLGLKEPYIGTCAIESGEIAEDFALYYALSCQQPSLVYLGVRVDIENCTVLSAAGAVIQPLPNCPDDVIDALTQRSKQIETLSKILEDGTSLESALETIFSDMQIEISEEKLTPRFECDCSKQRLEKVLISLGESELHAMANEDHGAELTCQFCNTKYSFSEDELINLAAEGKR